MNEGSVRAKLYSMLRHEYNLWPDHFEDLPGSKKPGRPDLIVMNPWGPGFYIEVKALYLHRDKAFAFENIEPAQRRWLSDWERARPSGSYLCLGVIDLCGSQRTKIVEIYLVPWPYWLDIETRVMEHQASLPYVAGKGFSKALQELGYDFRLLKQYIMGEKWVPHPLQVLFQRPA